MLHIELQKGVFVVVGSAYSPGPMLVGKKAVVTGVPRESAQRLFEHLHRMARQFWLSTWLLLATSNSTRLQVVRSTISSTTCGRGKSPSR